MLEIQAGEEILYVGDHLYSDVLRSKRTLGWRSAFVMPELEDEMRVFAENVPLSRQISKLRQLRDEFGIYADELRKRSDLSKEQLDKRLKEIDDGEQLIKAKLQELAARWHGAFHPVWGAMFLSGTSTLERGSCVATCGDFTHDLCVFRLSGFSICLLCIELRLLVYQSSIQPWSSFERSFVSNHYGSSPSRQITS
jgi:hypothetical protein